LPSALNALSAADHDGNALARSFSSVFSIRTLGISEDGTPDLRIKRSIDRHVPSGTTASLTTGAAVSAIVDRACS